MADTTFPPTTATLLSEIENSLSSYASFGSGCPERLDQAIRYSLLGGGKRLRPLLVLSAAQMCGSTVSAGMPAACAVEMVHTYSLIHDDLPAMDDDELRRGQPTCHIAFDEATAILAGDALLARAFEILATDIQPPEVAARCCAELAITAGATQLVGGQSDDLLRDENVLDVPFLESINQRKTAALLCTSVRLGAILAGAGTRELRDVTSYGRRLGLAFQIVDDLLDCQGDEQLIGKRTGQDQRQGKTTFPSLIGIEASEKRCQTMIDEACEALKSFGESAQPLIELARYIANRDR